MFGILKKKLSKAIDSISEKFKKKEQVSEKIEEVKEEIEKKIEELPLEKEKPEEIVEEIKPIIEEEILEVKKEVEEVKPAEGKLEVAEEIKPKIEEVAETKKEVEKIIEEAKPEIEKAEPKERKGLFKKIAERIVKKIAEKTLTEEDVEPILKEMEEGLIEADVAFAVAEKIKSDLRRNLVGREVKRGKEKEVVVDSLRQSLLGILSVPKIDLEEIIKKAENENRPAVFVFFGINGVGKSLNISKVAKLLKEKGHRPILAAGDTFRAAGDIQLEMYAQKIGVPVVKGQHGGDSCAIIFDARKSAEAKGNDVVLADTSGRMHTKKDLMDELAKIVRVNKPDLKILVLDSLSGGDVVLQYEFFDNIIGIDAVVFSKVDVNEKGGNILSICHNFKKPILFLGTGQEMDNLMEYDPDKLVENLL